MLDLNRDFLLLDGDCGLCHRLAFFMDSRLANNAEIAYRPIKSNDAQKLIQAFPIWQQRLDTVYLIRDGRSYIRSAAAIRCLLFMKWRYKIFFPFLWIVPLPIRDLAYIVISKNRHKIFAKPEICVIPTLNNDNN